MSLHTLAEHLQSAGRHGDSVLVHMSPREVQGLQALAMAHGGSLTINPQTGLPEAFFLAAILPTIAGMGLKAAGMSAMQAALTTGAIGTVATGSLGKGLMMGLGAYGGAGLGGGLFGAGKAAQGAAAQSLAATPAPVANLGSMTVEQMKGGVFGTPSAAGFGAPTAAITPVAPTVAAPAGAVLSPATGQPIFSPQNMQAAAAQPASVQTAVQQPSMFDRISEGAGKFFSGGEEGEKYRKEFSQPDRAI